MKDKHTNPNPRRIVARKLHISICMLFFLIPFLLPGFIHAQQLKVMKQGLGNGVIRTTGSSSINCGATCDANITTGTTVEIIADPSADSQFDRWEGNFPSSAVISGNTIRFVKPAGITTVRAKFKPLFPAGTDSIPPLRANQINPDSIRVYLGRFPFVNSMAKFLKALPAEYKQNWILMTRSESLQTGTAKYPRILLPSADAKNIFTIGLARHASFPGSHPNAIEYMQWDATAKNFRFHEIILNDIPATGVFTVRLRGVKLDDPKCFKCHSTQNVINDNSTHIGTTGIPRQSRPNEVVKSKTKPNWDAYDSWAGMLPFNRDRIYQGSLEEKAFRHIFNLWNWRGTPLNDSIRQVFEQLRLQPSDINILDKLTLRIDNTTNDTHIEFAFGRIDRSVTSTTNHNFGNPVSGSTTITQGGRYVVLKHTGNAADTAGAAGHEGRGVLLFDFLGGLKGNLNQTRVADEVVSHKWATGGHPIDVRPIALAIANNILRIGSSGNLQKDGDTVLVDKIPFFDARNGMNLANLRADTRSRTKTLPRRKADIQRANVDRTFPATTGATRIRDPYLLANEEGLYQLYETTGSPTIEYLRQQIFKRSVESRFSFVAADSINGALYVDREIYSQNTDKVTLYRYFLEPLGVSVDMWSMGVRARSLTYAFADVFGSYEGELRTAILDDFRVNAPALPSTFTGTFNPNNPQHLMAAVYQSLSRLPAVDEVPKFTDVQRIFNKACVACHGGLNYPPFAGFGILDLSEQEEPISFGDFPLDTNGYSNTASPRLWRSYVWASSYGSSLTGPLYRKISSPTLSERHSNSIMPSGGPRLSKTDVETIRRWIQGPPSRPFSLGDPHIKTVDGVSYDFQGDGEFVLLRGDYFEIQTRQKAVATAAQVGANEYTGLTSCVSINTAVAIFIAGHRITYEPSLKGKPDPKGMELRVDGELVSLNNLPMPFAPSSRIVRSSAAGGIQIEGVGGLVIVLTPIYWDYQQIWYLNIDIIKSRATEGLMGTIKSGNWLPALPDGTQLGPMPPSLSERYRILYNVFGNAWRVTDAISLFDYAPGTSTATFTDKNWPSNMAANCIPPGQREPQQPMSRGEAEQLAAGIVDPERKALAIIDLMATGDPSFAKVYLASDKITRNTYPNAPQLEYPADGESVNGTSIKLRWKKTTDENGDDLKYRIYIWNVNQMPDTNQAIAIPDPGGLFGQGVWLCHLILLIIVLLIIILLFKFFWKKRRKMFFLLLLLTLIAAFLVFKFICKDRSTTIYYTTQIQSGQRYFWKVIVEDGNGGVTESETRRFDIE